MRRPSARRRKPERPRKPRPMENHPLWPKGERHPATGEPLVDGTIQTETEIQELRFMPPSPPRRSLFEVDDYTDELVYVRELTDEEMHVATAAYNAAVKEWSRDQGVKRIAGRTETRGSFVTERGDRVDGIHDGGKWLWTRWSAVAS